MSLAFLASPPHRASLLDLDPSLGELMPSDRRRAAAAALRVDLRHLRRGALDIGRFEAASPSNLGFLIVEGIVMREVLLGETISGELLGAGDLIRPWNLGGGGELLTTPIRWSVVSEDMRAAVLDRRLAVELAQHPEVNVALFDRLNARASRLAVTQAISQLQRVDVRLLALFGHLAERWGRITPDGVLVPLCLSHRMLGQLVGARRPTVSTAVSQLARSGDLERRPDGSWLVQPQPAGEAIAPARQVTPRRALMASVGAAA
jgi:CRP/FNR family transcriptional regulator, cyclic AMP receptor protein